MAGKSKTYVIDASFVLALLLPDEQTVTQVQQFLASPSRISAPTLLPYEVANGLKSAQKQKRISQDSIGPLWHNFAAIPIHFEPVNLEKSLNLAIDLNLSVYDASYVWLAQSNQTKLLTLDKKLQQLFRPQT